MAKSKNIKDVNNSQNREANNSQNREVRTVLLNLGKDMVYEIYLTYENGQNGISYYAGVSVTDINGDTHVLSGNLRSQGVVG